MLLQDFDPDEYQIVVQSETCSYHKQHPGQMFAGCACYSSIGQVRRSDEEIRKIKEARRIAHEDAVLAEADEIRASRTRP